MELALGFNPRFVGQLAPVATTGVRSLSSTFFGEGRVPIPRNSTNQKTEADSCVLFPHGKCTGHPSCWLVVGGVAGGYLSMSCWLLVGAVGAVCSR